MLRAFDLGAEVLLTPLSRERAIGVLSVIGYHSIDPLHIGLQSVALHYAAHGEDLTQLVKDLAAS